MSTYSDYSLMPNSVSGGGGKFMDGLKRMHQSAVVWGFMAALGLAALVFSALVLKDLKKHGCGDTSVRGFSTVILIIISAFEAFALFRFGVLAYQWHESSSLSKTADRSRNIITSSSSVAPKQD